MMLGLNGREADVDVFRFFLAEKLSKTVGELDGMSHREYVEWQAYHTARNAMNDQKAVG